MMLSASSSVPLPISGTAEAAALASGEIPNLRFASAELQKSLLPVSGEAPLAPAALTQAAVQQGINPVASPDALEASAQLLHQITSSVPMPSSAIIASSASLAGEDGSSAVVVATPSPGGSAVPSALPMAMAVPPESGASAEGVVTVTATVAQEGGSGGKVKRRESSGGGGGGPKISARALLAQHKVKIPDDLTQLQPIPTTRTKSGWVGVYPARKGRWQAQVNHRSIGGHPTAWEAGLAVAAHLVVMARAEEQAELAQARGEEVPEAIVQMLEASPAPPGDAPPAAAENNATPAVASAKRKRDDDAGEEDEVVDVPAAEVVAVVAEAVV